MSALDRFLKTPLPGVKEAIEAYVKNSVDAKITIIAKVVSIILSTVGDAVDIPFALDDDVSTYFHNHGWLVSQTSTATSVLVFNPCRPPTPVGESFSVPDELTAKLDANTNVRLGQYIRPVITAVSTLRKGSRTAHHLPYPIKDWHLGFFGRVFEDFVFERGTKDPSGPPPTDPDEFMLVVSPRPTERQKFESLS
jgi:hypothetical protein